MEREYCSRKIYYVVCVSADHGDVASVSAFFYDPGALNMFVPQRDQLDEGAFHILGGVLPRLDHSDSFAHSESPTDVPLVDMAYAGKLDDEQLAVLDLRLVGPL